MPRVVTVKLVPGVLAETPKPAKATEPVLLQVTPIRAPKLASGVTWISLLAVTAMVLTVTVLAPTGITKVPAGAAPQTAGDALVAQLVVVRLRANFAEGAATLPLVSTVNCADDPTSNSLALPDLEFPIFVSPGTVMLTFPLMRVAPPMLMPLLHCNSPEYGS